jgi:ABC-type branched-subunit amino acid transport system substrate-binding protein
MRARLPALAVTLLVVAAACANSSSSKPAEGTSGGGSATTVAAADLSKNVPVTAPGVTNDSIGVVTITSTTNILGGSEGQLGDGIQAYFDYMNSTGGIYGRQLKILKRHDDGMFKNQQTVKASLAQDKAFATFIATPLFTGYTDLANSNPQMPTFVWNINPEFAGPKNFFGSIGALCNGCAGQGLPFTAQQFGFKNVGVIAYGSTQSSKDCGTSIKKSFEKYPSAKVVFFDNNVGFAQPDLSSQVAQMKQANVQYIGTCIDTQEALILAKELKRQGLNAAIQLPNAYDPAFASQNAQYLENDLVQVQFVPVEAQPQIPEMQTMLEWLQKKNYSPTEMRIEGWILANQFVTGLKLAGPEFSQQKVIDGLNTQTAYTANGLIRPIDWTRQHNDPKGHPEYDYKDNCFIGVKIQGGKFVMATGQGDKPWTCMVGGPQDQAATLTTTPEYKSFAP